MTKIRESQDGGTEYLAKDIEETPQTYTRAVFFRWEKPEGNVVKLKITKRDKARMSDDGKIHFEKLHSKEPKSEIYLSEQGLESLASLLASDYPAIKAGEKQYVAVGDLGEERAKQIEQWLSAPDSQPLLDFLVDSDVLSEDLLAAAEHRHRCTAVEEFERMLAEDLPERAWQKWFATNDWVFGTDFIRVLDERSIDVDAEADYLVEAHDGFLDIVEIKKPSGLKFWSWDASHKNWYPAPDLVQAITQSSAYLLEIERQTDSKKFTERVDGVAVVKPRAILLFGRNIDWDANRSQAFRLLNSQYHNISVLTYDHVLLRAKRMLGIASSEDDDDI